jgi:hypothetical protein
MNEEPKEHFETGRQGQGQGGGGQEQGQGQGTVTRDLGQNSHVERTITVM